MQNNFLNIQQILSLFRPKQCWIYFEEYSNIAQSQERFKKVKHTSMIQSHGLLILSQ